MARIPLGALTTLNLATHLDPMFIELYNIFTALSTGNITYTGSLSGGSAAAISADFAGAGRFKGWAGVSTAVSGVQLGAPLGASNISMCHAGAAANSKLWDLAVEPTSWSLRCINDTVSGVFPAIIVTRSGITVSSVGIGAALAPTGDNIFSCGVPGGRWTVVYAASGSINTSDAREKTSVRPLNSAELAAAKQLSREIGAYRFLSSVREKGDAAREHIGMTVQRAIEVMDSFGLDPMAYGFICYDSWPAEVKPAQYREDQRDTGMLDTAGNPIMETERVEIAPEEVIPAGDRYSFRPDELLMFIARGLEARLAALEAA